MYKTILKAGKDEFTEKKSLFIGYSHPVETEDQALDFIEKIRKVHYDATHNCTAYVLGPNMDIQRFNDDGEPSGTAGLPMVEALKREEITNTALVVTRYFGGIKLGAGGLIRAYAKGARIAIEAGIPVDMVPCSILSLKYDYGLHGSIENFLNTSGHAIVDTIYTDSVDNHILIRQADIDQVKSRLVDMTSDTIDISLVEELLKPEREGDLILD